MTHGIAPVYKRANLATGNSREGLVEPAQGGHSGCVVQDTKDKVRGKDGALLYLLSL